MEKIVTKIGDVTIERRVSKNKVPLESSYGNNVQQSNHPLSKIASGLTKADELARLAELTQSGFKQELTITRPTSTSSYDKPFSLGSDIDIKIGSTPKKQISINSHDFSGNYLKTEISQNSDGDFQYMPNEKFDHTKDSGESLSKVPRINVIQKQSVLASVKGEKSEPDLSKLVGISIERRKPSNIESQPSKPSVEEDLSQTTNFNPSISIRKINLKDSPDSCDDMDSKNKEVLSEEEDSFEEGDLDDENVLLKIKEEQGENVRSDSSQAELECDEEHDKSESDEIAVVEDEAEEVKKSEEDDGEEALKKEDEEEVKEASEEESDTKKSDINDFACTDLMELMKKGEIEGEIEDVKDEIKNESEDKKVSKRKTSGDDDEEEDDMGAEDDDNGDDDGDGDGDGDGEGEEEGEDKNGKPAKKKRKSADKGNDKEGGTEEEGDEESKNKNMAKSKITNAGLRKNIREVMDETKLDEATLAAQRQEAERLKRLQEQQRIIREVQRQIALNRQNQKSQNKVLSLLQGNTQTSILKTSSTATQVQSSQAKTQNSVLVKLSNGEQTSLNNKKMLELLKNSKNKTVLGKPQIPRTLFKQGMVTPSVSIAPIVKKESAIDDKKKKKGDVVTLSSDSEDDCIVLSEEDESEPEEDPTNSGMHTNDKYNLPDEKGQVIVNVGHPESESDLYLAPQIARVIKPHQIGGIRFLYDNVIESTERFSTSTGFGCILAHSMGLGKTLQIISFSDIFLRYTPAKTILCIMPINTIQNWLAEFNFWLPKESSSAEEVRCREFDLYIVNESLKNINSRAKVIMDWQKSGGVLLMGYELFRLLSLKKSCKSKKKKRDPEEDDAKNKELIEEIYSALVVPGPDLVICDEGHRIKNSHATTSQALKQIRTKRRIVLTGYPLQNNLLEYWCMVDFVRPNYLGTKTEFSNMFERPIQNGQCIDSTPQDKRLMRYRAHVLHSLLEGFVQRRSHAVLQSALPEKEEYVLLLRFTPFQRKLYDTFMNEVVRTVAVPNPLKAFAVCCKIWNHPDVLYNFLKKKGEEIDLDLEEVLPPSLQIPQYPYGQQGLGMDGGGQLVPGGSPWPKRGPGSRGGKIRQGNARKNGRGRKPAATIPPSPVTSAQEKANDSFASGRFPTGENFSPQQENLEGFQGRNYNQNHHHHHHNFGFGNEYESQSSSAYGNSNYQKNPLGNSIDEISMEKRFFSQPNGNRVQYGNPHQNFDSGQPETGFSNSNESNLTAGFVDSNLNSTDSAGFNQTESIKSFDYNQEFNSEFYSSGNFRENKSSVFQSNPNPYYQNQSGFRNSESFDYPSVGGDSVAGGGGGGGGGGSNGGNMNPNFQSYPDRCNSNFQNSGFQSSVSRSSASGQGVSGGAVGGQVAATFQNSGSGNFQTDSNSGSNSNFPPNFQSADSGFEGNRFGGHNPNSNFQSGGSNFGGKDFQARNSSAGTNFQGGNYEQGFWSQSNWGGYGESGGSRGNTDYRNGSNSAGNDFVQQQQQQKLAGSFNEGRESKAEVKDFGSGSNSDSIFTKMNCDYSPGFEKAETESKSAQAEFEESKGTKPKEEEEKKEEAKNSESTVKKEESLSYDWATDLFKSYVTGIIENSSKMEVFFHIVTESVNLSDRLLVFSQSLLTLDLIEDYLHRKNVPGTDEFWVKNKNYFRLDGSTPGLEREKLINEFNGNQNVHLFLVSTRAGSLGINLVGANRVVVFDASWNPCHDTQAVCRVYRYGQRKPCFVYRLVMDSCLEKKIYDRQVNKQGMADRVVDELNPDAHLSIKEVTNLCWDDQGDTTVKDFSHLKEKYNDEIVKILLERCSKWLSKEPFRHESLLIDRKEKKLSQAEKRLAKRSYELEKQAANQPKSIYSFFPNAGQRNFVKPIASVRPMQSEMNTRMSPQLQNRSKWIPAEVWQKQGMSAQEMTLPLDVVIPTSSPEKTSIVLKAGQRVMVLKSPKGIYMQLENGKIIAIRSAFKVGQNAHGGTAKNEEVKNEGSTSAMKSLGNMNASQKLSQTARPGLLKQPFKQPFTKFPEKKLPVNTNAARSRQVMGKAKPFLLNRKLESVTPDVKQRLMGGKMGGVGGQEEKSNSSEATIVEEKPIGIEKTESNPEERSFFHQRDGKMVDSSEPEKKTDEKPEEEECELTDSLETLRKVTEKISDSASKREEGDAEVGNQQIDSLKNYRHNPTSQAKGTAIAEEKMQEGGGGSGRNETKEAVSQEKKEGRGNASQQQPQQQQGSENVQNWLMNQSYPPVDPYGNYFPGYYAYGPGPAPMMAPYDGFYPPSNYAHPMGRNSSMVNPASKQSLPDGGKGNSQPVQPLLNPIVHNSSPAAKNPPVINTPPVVNTPTVYPPYPNPYSYHYNYPTNPNFNGQGFPLPNQNQSAQQTGQNSSGGNGSSSAATAATTAQTSTPSQSQPAPYDNSMYSAFHRPEAPFQAPENPYPSPYPRPPYPSSGTPGFFPYNPPYTNYPYGHNFNPYMHPSGYGYPMQNHSSANGGSQRSNSHVENPGGGSGGGASNSASSNSS